MNAHVKPIPIEQELRQHLTSWEEPARILASQCTMLKQREVAVALCQKKLCDAELLGFRKGLELGRQAFDRALRANRPPSYDLPSVFLTIIGTAFVILFLGLWLAP